MANQVCRVCAETFPLGAPACPRCGFGAASVGVPVGAYPGEVVGPQGFSNPPPPPPPASFSGYRPATDAPAGPLRAAGLIALVIALAMAGGVAFVVMQVVDNVSEVTGDIAQGLQDPAGEGPGGAAPGGFPQSAIPPAECIEVVTRYANDVIENISDGSVSARVFQQAATSLDPATLQVLVEVVGTFDVAGPAALGNFAKAKRNARPLIRAGCRGEPPPIERNEQRHDGKR